MNRIRVIIADDHAVLRAGLKALLDTQPDIQVVGEAGDAPEALEAVKARQPDVVLMDVSMPGGGAVAATREIGECCPTCHVIVLTTHDDVTYLRQFLNAGAAGYVVKKEAHTELVDAIRTVHKGGVYIYPPLVKALAVGELERIAARRASGKEALSDREREVVRFTALGYSHQQIADKLCLSIKTVETYKARVMEKLNLESRVELVQYAISRGWMEAE